MTIIFLTQITFQVIAWQNLTGRKYIHSYIFLHYAIRNYNFRLISETTYVPLVSSCRQVFKPMSKKKYFLNTGVQKILSFPFFDLASQFWKLFFPRKAFVLYSISMAMLHIQRDSTKKHANFIAVFEDWTIFSLLWKIWLFGHVGLNHRLINLILTEWQIHE